MVGDWEETTLGDCADWLSGGTPSKGNVEFWCGSIPWVSAKDMKSFHLYDAEDHISPLAIGNGGKVVPAGTIFVLVRGMTLHHDVPICMTHREMAFNQDIKALRPAKNVDGAFLAYWLLAHKPDLLASVDQAGHGTGRLVTDTLKKKRVQLPSLQEQKAIAGMLGVLDAKIECNRRMNATLESMARALFQSWFVDFDPVRAKLDGRAPTGIDPATAALFPAHFDRTDEHLRPHGWSLSRLGDHVDLVRGNTYKSKLKDLPGPFLLGLGSINRNGGFRDDSLRTYGGESSPKLLLQPGDLFASLKDVTQAADLLGAVARVPAYVLSGRLTQDTVKLVPRDSGISFVYLYWTLLRPEYREYCRGRATGTTNLGLSREDFLNYPVLTPPKPIQAAFDAIESQIESKIANNRAQSRTLAAIRDALLPKLLSGELRVAG